MSLTSLCMPNNLIFSSKQQWRLKEIALFPQVKELLMDKEAAQYFVKLHVIAGQMNTECMNNTDTFYTLTGKSGEIFSGDKVRDSLIFTPRTKASAEPLPTACLSVVSLWFMKNFPYPLFVKALSCEVISREQHQEGSSRRGLLWEKGYKVWDCALVWIYFQGNIIQVPEGRRSFTVNLFPGGTGTKPDQCPSYKRKQIMFALGCWSLSILCKPSIPSLLMLLGLFCCLSKTTLPSSHK